MSHLYAPQVIRIVAGCLAAIVLSAQALALDLGSLSNADAVSGLKDALMQGSNVRSASWVWKTVSSAMTK